MDCSDFEMLKYGARILDFFLIPVMPFVVKWAWNHVMPPLLGWPPIESYWQAAALMVLLWGRLW